MAAGIYKPGQGYWTRLMTAIGLGMVVLMGAVWLADQFGSTRIADLEPVWTRAIVFSLVVAVFGILGYHLVGRKPAFVDFMIATEGEMKKVNWSTRREIVGSTYVVIGFTVLIALYCFGFDRLFQYIFIRAGVLEYS